MRSSSRPGTLSVLLLFMLYIRTFIYDRFLPSSDMPLPGWCSPGSGPLCGTLPLYLDGEVLTLRGSELLVLRIGTAVTLGSCPTLLYTCCSALLCLSPSSPCRTLGFSGPSARWAHSRKGAPCSYMPPSICRPVFCVPGDQAAGG